MVTSAQLCVNTTRCPKDTCCVSFFPLFGVCHPLSVEGEKCLGDEMFFPLTKIHMKHCPCSQELVCPGKIKKGIMKYGGKCQLPPPLPTTAAPEETSGQNIPEDSDAKGSQE